jgi:hypothetical protein
VREESKFKAGDLCENWKMACLVFHSGFEAGKSQTAVKKPKELEAGWSALKCLDDDDKELPPTNAKLVGAWKRFMKLGDDTQP